MDANSGPLRQEHLDALNAVLKSYHAAMDLARKCESCGWEVQQFIDVLNAQKAMAEKTKATFFPNMP